MSKEETEKKPQDKWNLSLLAQTPQSLTDFFLNKVTREILDDVNNEFIASLPKIKSIPTKSEVDLLAHYNEQVINSNLIETAIITQIASNTLLTLSAATTSIGDILDEYMNTPANESARQMAVDTMTAVYRLNHKPLIDRYLLSYAKPLIPEPYRLAVAHAGRLLDDNTYLTAMAENGFNSTWAFMWSYQNLTYLPPEILLTLLRRGDIEEAAFDTLMQKSAYTDGQITDFKKLKEVIPPLDDLIRMAIREAFGAHTAEEQLPELHTWAAKMGLSAYFTDAYWYAHWDRIALAQMYDNLYRGYWDKDRFMDMLRIKDVHPDDREDIFNVAYQVPSLRELGYGFDTGFYKLEDIDRFRRYGGLSPDDAKTAADSMVAYRTEAEREAVRREHLHLFALGKETEEQFREKLAALTTHPAAIELWVERGILEAERKLKPDTDVEYRIVTSSEAKWMFINGLREAPWYREKLEALDWDEERITVAIERAEKELEPVEEKPKESLATVTMLEYLYKRDVIDLPAINQALEARNYPELQRNIIIQVWDIERADAERKEAEALEVKPAILSMSMIETLYKDGLKGVNWARAGLEALRYIPEDINNIITLWDKELAEKKAKEEEAKIKAAEIKPVLISVAELEKLYKAGQRSKELIIDDLTARNWTEPSISLQLDVWNKEVAEIAAKTEETERVKALPKELTRTDIVHEFEMGRRTFDEMIEWFVGDGYPLPEAKSLATWVRFNIVYPELRALYGKGWIDTQTLLDETRLLGVPEERAIELVMTTVKYEQPSRLEDERKLTKAEITKGVKAGVIIISEGVALLMDIGYEEWEAYYILTIAGVVEAGDPEGYWDMKRVTEAYKKAIGKPSKKVPDELLIWEQRVKQLQAEKERLEAEGIDEQKLSEVAIRLNDAEANYKRLMMEWTR